MSDNPQHRRFSLCVKRLHVCFCWFFLWYLKWLRVWIWIYADKWTWQNLLSDENGSLWKWWKRAKSRCLCSVDSRVLQGEYVSPSYHLHSEAELRGEWAELCTCNYMIIFSFKMLFCTSPLVHFIKLKFLQLYSLTSVFLLAGATMCYSCNRQSAAAAS